MSEVEQYIHDVLRNIQAPPHQRARVAADLRAHLEEAVQAGEAPSAVIARMGTAAEVAAEFMSQVTLHYASFWRRLVAFVVDVVLLTGTAMPMAWVSIWLSNRVARQPQGGDYVVGGVLIAVTIAVVLTALGVLVLYFPILEGRFGQTLGKRLLRLHVLKETGLPIGYKEAFLRRLSFYFDFIALDALFIPFTAKRQRAFDIIARTVVIREPE